MKEQSNRSLVTSALAFTVVFSALNLYLAGGDLMATILVAPVFFLVMFTSMRVSRALTRRLSARWNTSEPPAPPTEPSSDRPQHARRRRRRRGGRGRRRGGGGGGGGTGGD